MHALFWCKASREDVFLNDENWWENRLLCFTSDCNIPYWPSLSLGEIKFNVDGAASVGSASCGGVLRTSEEKFVRCSRRWCLFLKQIL
ncbi:hypothetical protein V6N12_057420 [Hibiscus sabdariffa]|uniref:RNase H type-1 domain-containing protein n=1 Tax=Hibiscus sabdariffa TaxID=183260 RepID=A0ABR2C516_9ROSI